MNEYKFSTGFLFTTPTFLTGAGTVFNLAGSFYKFNVSDSGTEADRIAIEHDFRMVGHDIKHSMKQIKKSGKELITAK